MRILPNKQKTHRCPKQPQQKLSRTDFSSWCINNLISSTAEVGMTAVQRTLTLLNFKSNLVVTPRFESPDGFSDPLALVSSLS